MKYVGVDGCRAGWIAVGTRDCISWDLVFHETLVSLFQSLPRQHLVLIDIPIGLPENKSRECDILARMKLGARRSSIFAPPCREALKASDYREACTINQEKLGRQLSIQSWNICTKILEIDVLLRNRPTLKGKWREAHPELAFRAMNGGIPLQNSKRKIEGREERILQLEKYLIDVRKWLKKATVRIPGSKVATDDVLDALALSLSATEIPGQLKSIPGFYVEQDAHGLPMCIWYPSP